MGFVVGRLWQLRCGARLGQSPRHPPGRRAPKPVEVLSEVAAVQEMVRQLHAMVYGYQLAIGKLKVLSKTRPRAERELLAQPRFPGSTDRLAAETLRGGSGRRAGVRAVGRSAQRGHGRQVDHANADCAAAVLRALAGRALKATPTARKLSSALGSEVKIARSWGAPLGAWPGWSS